MDKPLVTLYLFLAVTLASCSYMDLIKEVIPERNYTELEASGTSDFGYAHGDKCRFRVSVLTQKGHRGMVMRLIPHKLLSFEQIGLPDSVRELLDLHRGHGLSGRGMRRQLLSNRTCVS